MAVEPSDAEALSMQQHTADGDSDIGDDVELDEDHEVAPKRQRRKAPADATMLDAGVGVDAAEAAAGALAEAAAGSVLETVGEEAAIARLRGLPWSYGVSEVCEFVSGIGVTLQEEAVTMMHNAAGEAFITLETPLQLAEVVKANRQQVGRRYVEIFSSTVAEKQASCERNRATMRADAAFRGVLRMRGLPFSASVDEVLEFLGSPSTLQRSNVHLMRRADGRASGDAYAVYETEAACVDALSRDKQKLGARWIDLFQSTKGELYCLMSLGGIQLSGGEGGEGAPASIALGEGYSVVKLRGLPWGVTTDDIVQFLSGIEVPAGGVHLMSGYNGRPSGLAYVELQTEEDQKEAVKKDKEVIGGRYIDVFQCTQSELQARLAGGMERGMGGNLSQSADANFVKLRGLPYSATESQIAAFFAPLPVVSVQVAFNGNGQPSGFGFVQLRTPDDAESALTRSSNLLGNRYVEVFRGSRGEMEQARLNAMAVMPQLAMRNQQMHGAHAMQAHMALQQMHMAGGGQGGGGGGKGSRGAAGGGAAFSAYQAALQTLASRQAQHAQHAAFNAAATVPQSYNSGANYPVAAADGGYGAHGAAALSPAVNSEANYAGGAQAAYNASYAAYSAAADPSYAAAVPGAGQQAAAYAQGAGYGQSAGGYGSATGSYAPSAAGYGAPSPTSYGAQQQQTASQNAGSYQAASAANYAPQQGYSAADYGYYTSWYAPQ